MTPVLYWKRLFEPSLRRRVAWAFSPYIVPVAIICPCHSFAPLRLPLRLRSRLIAARSSWDGFGLRPQAEPVIQGAPAAARRAHSIPLRAGFVAARRKSLTEDEPAAILYQGVSSMLSRANALMLHSFCMQSRDSFDSVPNSPAFCLAGRLRRSRWGFSSGWPQAAVVFFACTSYAQRRSSPSCSL
jgi:hypothetical protein